MLTRRALLQASAATALFTPFVGFTQARAQSGGPVFRFGVVADPQYSPVPPRGTRFYANSLWKMTDAIADFNTQDIAFVATLGDIIDRGWESYTHILPLYDRLTAPNFFVLGNHDYSVASDYLMSVLRMTGLERAYYDYEGGGHRFIVLDGNEISTFANLPDSENFVLAEERYAKLVEAGAANAQTWNGGISDAQFAWVTSVMDKAKAASERVIAMGHYPLYPANEHNMWDDARLVELFSSYDNFALYMNGHNHAGNYGQIGKKHFVNLKGMVETATTTAYATIEVHDDRIEILGKGVEPNQTLML